MLKHVSVSSLDLYRKNPRRWCLKYLEGFKEKETEAMRFGTDLHKEIETIIFPGIILGDSIWMRNQEIMDKWLSKFKPHIGNYTYRATEHKFEMPWVKKELKIRGIIDCYVIENNNLQVWDHKTGNSKYFNKVIDLPRNYQLVLYAHYLQEQNNKLFDSITIGQNQFTKKFDQLGPHGTAFISEYRIVKNILTQNDLRVIIKEMKQETRRLLKTEKLYRENGLMAIPETPKNEWWYGKKDPWWDVISGKVSIEDAKKQEFYMGESEWTNL